MCLYFPRYAGGADPIDLPQPHNSVEAGRGETVLVIDDGPVVRKLMIEVLEEAGYAAIEAADGPAGLRLLQSDARIDLLITDVGLQGGINRRQVADAARATRPDSKVLCDGLRGKCCYRERTCRLEHEYDFQAFRHG